MGGVTGTVDAPQELILGRYERGHLEIAVRTTPAARPPARSSRRSWTPPHTPGQRLCPRTAGAAPCLNYTRVRPDVVVEVSAGLALDGLRWRHPVRFV